MAPKKIFNPINCIKAYIAYKKAIKELKSNHSYKIIFKLDDLVDFNSRVANLDSFIKKENLKVCWGIVGKSMEKADKKYINFIKNNHNKNYQFFNHGYLHLCGPEYEFIDKTKEEQENFINKTQKIVFDKTGINLEIFGAPCNHIDENTKLSLELIPEIKYWFYGMEQFKKCNIKRVIDMENGVGKPDFTYFINNLKNLDNKNQVLTLQGHPYMWKLEQQFNFYLIIKFLKKANCEFIFPSEININN